jgi:hypothetical protein
MKDDANPVDEWNCSACTFAHTRAASQCEICETPAPAHVLRSLNTTRTTTEPGSSSGDMPISIAVRYSEIAVHTLTFNMPGGRTLTYEGIDPIDPPEEILWDTQGSMLKIYWYGDADCGNGLQAVKVRISLCWKCLLYCPVDCFHTCAFHPVCPDVFDIAVF